MFVEHTALGTAPQRVLCAGARDLQEETLHTYGVRPCVVHVLQTLHTYGVRCPPDGKEGQVYRTGCLTVLPSVLTVRRARCIERSASHSRPVRGARCAWFLTAVVGTGTWHP